jgi:NAD(P)-dependent dehydrogenase (short-subunit alcohol dehydrogenase family)
VAWGQLIDTNLKGLYYGIRYALPFMKSNNGGTILNVGSGAAKTPLEGWSHYCSSKAAVHHLTACLHKEEAENGIRALTLSPGTVATDMQKIIAKSGINSVSELSWEEHIDAHWPAMALAWMTTSESDGWLGQTVSLRDKKIRELIGLK